MSLFKPQATKGFLTSLLSRLRNKTSDKVVNNAPSEITVLKEGNQFPKHIRFNVVSSRKFRTFK